MNIYLKKIKEMNKQELIDFMKWYKNTIPIGTLDSSEIIIEKYLQSLSSKEPEEQKEDNV
jgi:hypothetical protein